MLNKVFEYELFNAGAISLTVGQVVMVVLVLLIARLLWRLTKAKWRLGFFNRNEVDVPNRRRFERLLRQGIGLLTALAVIKILEVDFPMFDTNTKGLEDGIVVRYSILIVALFVLVGLWTLEWFFTNILIHKYEQDRVGDAEDTSFEEQKNVRTKIIKLVQYIVLALAMMSIISTFGWDFSLFDYPVGKEEKSFTPTNILSIVLIFLLAQIVTWILTQVVLYGVFKKKGIDQGTRFAINQLIKYVIYTIALFLAIHSLSINMTIILGGAAALLVGIGLGLQQTFNDFFSGLVLLFERSVSVGDIMDVGGDIGAVKKIGLRSSIIETRESQSIIVPNSKLVNESVKNLSHFTQHGRFIVSVGVAYGSDTALVKSILLKVAQDHGKISIIPQPFVRFEDFADSSLNFSVYFFTNKFMDVEDIKSDLRMEIDRLFREHQVEIPFPQRDVWMKS